MEPVMLTVTDLTPATDLRVTIDANWINDRVSEINQLRANAVYSYGLDPAGSYPVNTLIAGLTMKGYQARITNGVLTVIIPAAPAPIQQG